jgi:hypothetical protein
MRGIIQFLTIRKSILGIKSKVKKERREFECPLCKIKFTCESSVERHQFVHTPDKLFQLYNNDVQNSKQGITSSFYFIFIIDIIIFFSK